MAQRMLTGFTETIPEHAVDGARAVPHCSRTRTPSNDRLVYCRRRRDAFSLLVAVVLVAGWTGWSAAAEGPQTPEPSTPASEASIVVAEGQITDAHGAGAPDATVRLFRESDWPDGRPLASTTTDEFGDFTIRLAEAPSGPLVIVVSRERFETFVQRFTPAEDGTPVFIGATLEGSLTLSGRVTDRATGAALAGASVRLNDMSGEKTVPTDEAGRFRFKGLSPGPGALTVTFDGFGRERREFDDLADASDEVLVELQPQRIAAITITDDRGAPIRGVLVECYDRRHDHYQAATSDDQGRVVLTGLHFDAHTLNLRLSHESHVSSADFDREIRLPREPLRSEHTLSMQRAGVISGRVTAATSGEPIYGARVIVGTEYSDDTPRDWTDIKGFFTIRGVPPGATAVTAHAADFAPELATVSVKAGETTTVNLTLPAPVLVHGVVTNSEGRPVPDAEVRSAGWRGAMTLALRAMTDAEGRFELRDAPADPFDIVVMAAGYKIVHHRVASGGSQPLNITLERLPAPRRGDVVRLRPGDTAPPFSVTTMDGKAISSRDLLGRYVLLDFWATWCPPCIDELPYLAKLHEKYGKRNDFMVLSISRDFDESDLRQFLRKHKEFAAWAHVVGPSNGAEKTRLDYGVSGIPRSFIIGPDGKIIDYGRRGERLIAQVDEIMRRADASSDDKDSP